MVSLRHDYTATGTNNPDKQVSVDRWNAEHDLTGTAGTVLGFDAAGQATELSATFTAASRAALAASNTAAGAVYLTESGREGTFVWLSSNLSTQVTADTAQGIYVAPATDGTGASGAWVRQFSGPININWFGAVPDCTAVGTGTNNAPAINDALAVAALDSKSAEVLIPANILGYRVSSTLVFTIGVKLKGQGWHENPGQIGGTTYTAPQNWRGSILVFDQNVAGLQFIAYTDNLANATAFEYEGSSYSLVEDLALYGGGGTTVTAHGIESRTILTLRNVRVENFAGNGLKIIAYTAGANPYGNASISKFDHLVTRGNKCHGVLIEGTDDNVLSFVNCDSSLNGGVGFLDKSLIGNNSYLSCHAATNNQSFGLGTAARTQVVADWAGLSDANAGSYVTVHGGGQANLYLSCYTETGQGTKAEIIEPGIVIGGLLAETGSRTAAWTANVWQGGAATGLAVQRIAPRGGTLEIASNTTDFTTNGTATARFLPGSGTYSNLRLFGNTNSIALGLDLLAGNQNAYFSCDAFLFRNAAQTTSWFSADSTGLNVLTGALKINGTSIINSSGVLQAAGFPALTGDVTTSAGSLATTLSSATVVSKIAAQALAPASVAATGAITSSSATAGIGYATGAGGAVTQITSKSTATPAINKASGQVTMNNAALAAGAKVSFVVTNNTAAATDTPVVAVASGGTANAYRAEVTAVAAGSGFTVTVENITAGSLSEAPVINFALIKGVAA